MLKLDTRRTQLIAILVSATLAFTAHLLGLSRTLEPLFEGLRFSLLQHDASGKVVVVEMDASSVASIREWPWPRRNYAEVIYKLKKFGASSIVFDVDFSSSSTPDDDMAFAAALKAAEGLVALPTFAQPAGSGDARSIDTLPLKLFRPYVALASVSIAPDQDGVVRNAPFGTVTDGLPRPSLSSYIAATAGSADASFPIDFSIRTASIPRVSFVALRDGKVDPRTIRGKTVLIGATAIEMGDRYATPSLGVIPGVIVQALAAETLFAGVPKRGSSFALLAVAVLLSAAIVSRGRGVEVSLVAVSASVIYVAGVLLLQAALNIVFALAPGLLTLLITTVVWAIALSLSRFQQQRTVDEGTGLQNRRAMLAPGKIDPKCFLAVADLNNLESIARVLGPSAVSDILKRTADRLSLGSVSDVFLIGDGLLAFTIDPHDDLEDALRGLRLVIQQPLEIAGRKVDVSVALGIARIDTGGLDSAIAKAILGADKAAAQGWFWAEEDPDLAELDRSITLMAEMDDALAREEIVCFYQPKYSLKEQRITSVEALARWNHPTRGPVRPDHFIPLAEKMGRIAGLTTHLMRQALQDMAAWRAAGHDVAVAINISAKLVCSSAFKAEVLRLLDDAGVVAHTLIFEVTESATLDDPAAAATALSEFKARGVIISMDDYGTGQSTLTYLRTLPISELKIDKSFVENAHKNRNDALMVRSTIELAHDLGLKVVAEGVEELECFEFLRSVSCDLVQGYLISKAISCDALIEFLALASPFEKAA